MRYFSVIALLFIVSGCVKVTYEQRINITSEFDDATHQQLAIDVAKCLQSRPFALALRERFPSVTDVQMMTTDVRVGWTGVLDKGKTRQWWVSFGSKDASALPNARAIIDYSCDYANREHTRLVEKLRVERRKNA